ncbi:MAG: hypothetical protein HBSAPP03_02010 [Phycisphaerae bacterium]|nr:MAG: hypothetical protein HBSAPP03_02010 [Phycisphaerae bacterium]
MMKMMRTAVAMVMSFGAMAFGQGGVSVIAVEDPEALPGPPTCSEPPSYLLADGGGGLWAASTIDEGVLCDAGVFVVLDEEILATGVNVDIDGRIGFCTWVLCMGEFTPVNGTPVSRGMIRADVALIGGGEPETFNVGSELPAALAEQAIAAARETVVIVVEEGEAEPESALGSSCHCDECPGPGGGRFWIPFTVIGIGQTPGGISCCATACATGCARMRSGMPLQEAWLVGQGTWVACMICQ